MGIILDDESRWNLFDRTETSFCAESARVGVMGCNF